MSEKDTFRTRRTVLQLAGVAVASGSLAGCLDDSTGDDDADPTNAGTIESDDNSTDDSEGSDADDTDNTVQGIEIEPGTAIEFDGQTAGWEGIAPSSIEGALNPTLVLTEGETYEMGWTIGDGAQHNIAIRNDNGAVVDDLATEGVVEPRDQWLEFEASSEMTTYVCKFHETTMVGEIVIVDSDGTVVESDTTTDDEPDETVDTYGKTVELEPGADIRFSGQTVSWEGLSPAALEGVENPTLVLQEGEDYSIGWTDGDGAMHNLQIRNDSDEIVNGLETPMVTEPDKDQILEFTASPEMTQYACHPHETTMIGSIRVE
ncbi:plastocyanin [Natrinema sp. HArc-T2]|uniref:plastocyanin n=1 Tax=Natrinema sp. HArc-T2 TaxID=3242701 RepID=UPI00359D27CF